MAAHVDYLLLGINELLGVCKTEVNGSADSMVSRATTQTVNVYEEARFICCREAPQVSSRTDAGRRMGGTLLATRILGRKTLRKPYRRSQIEEAGR